MIGRGRITTAINESFHEHGGNSRESLAGLGFDNRAVDEKAEALLAHYSTNEVAPEIACKAAFVLGLELGYRIARREHRGR
jgi:hypothetical protein